MNFDIVTTINELTQGNEMATALILGGLAATGGYVLRQSPIWVGNFLKRYFTTTVQYENTYADYEIFEAINVFVSKNMSSTGCRTFDISNVWSEVSRRQKPTLQLGRGVHLFFWNRRFYWINIVNLDSSGTNLNKKSATLGTFGRDRKHIDRFVAATLPSSTDSKLSIMAIDDHHAVTYSKVSPLNLTELTLSKEVTRVLVEILEHFNNLDSYVKLGLPEKINLLMVSKPGYGKSTIAKTIASELDSPIVVANLSTLKTGKLPNFQSAIPDKSVVLFEDFELSNSVRDRRESAPLKDNDSDEVTLSEVLNLLDGVAPLTDTFNIFTTNHLELVDPAFYRAGRIDYILEIPPIPSTEVKEHVLKFGNPEVLDLDWIDMTGAEMNLLNAALVKGTSSTIEYLNALKEMDRSSLWDTVLSSTPGLLEDPRTKSNVYFKKKLED